MANPLYGQNKYDASRDDTITVKSGQSLSVQGGGAITLDESGFVPDAGNQAFGIYEGAYELRFGATTGGSTSITATDNGLVKTVATLPANAFILSAYMLTSEVFDSDDEKGLDLVMTSTSPTAADVAISGAVVQVIESAEFKSSSGGALNSLAGAVFSGTTATSVIAGGAGTHLCLINTDTSNVVDAIQTGKVIVYIKYAGSAAPAVNTTV